MTQSSQSFPDLLKLLIGGGGIVTVAGSFTGFLVKKHIDTLNQANHNLRSENDRLKASLAKAEADEKASRDEVESLVTIFETLQDSDLSPSDAARLKRILGGLHRIKSLQGEFEVYKTAARWLNYRKTEWVNDAAKIAIQQHSELVPRRTRQKFKKDIASYLDWVYTSLYVYGHPDAPIRKFVHHPSVRSSYPYLSAIDCLKNNGDRGDLTIEESTSLERMLDELMNKIRNEFSNT